MKDTFMGFVRPDGRVGVRNQVVAAANVCCVNGVVQAVAAEVPGVIPLLHTGGCGRGVEDQVRFKRTLMGLCSNPNNYAVLLIGLGCESLDADEVAEELRQEGVKVFSCVSQRVGGSGAATRMAAEAARRFIEEASRCEREECPVSSLVIGTECGGSDALSGITANPAMGYVSDWIVSRGGTSILTEVTEFSGTEDILAARAVSEEVGREIKERILANERDARELFGAETSRTIARGNMDGGMSTIQEKSLGCIRKGGKSPITGVAEYGQRVCPGQGLVIMDGPGYDVDSLTGLAASGAQIILFSSGRGNPVGHPVVPVIKLCSNPETYEMVGGDGGDMDLNCGRILTEGLSVEEMGEECLAYLLEVANGKLCMPEAHRQTGIVCIYTTTRSF